MAKLIIHKEADPEARELERHLRFKGLSPEDKLKELCKLIELTIMLGGENNLKQPSGKGVVLRKKTST